MSFALRFLSERSALDDENLIREIHPDAVVVLVGHGVEGEIQALEAEFSNEIDVPVPTTSSEVLRRCFCSQDK